jgi:hypothetical protein
MFSCHGLETEFFLPIQKLFWHLLQQLETEYKIVCKIALPFASQHCAPTREYHREVYIKWVRRILYVLLV